MDKKIEINAYCNMLNEGKTPKAPKEQKKKVCLTESPVATQTLLDISHLDPIMRKILIDCIASTGLVYGRDFFIQSNELFIANCRIEGPQLAILMSYNINLPGAKCANSNEVYHIGIPEDDLTESIENYTDLDVRSLTDVDRKEAIAALEKSGLKSGEDFELNAKSGWILNTKYDYPQVEIFKKYGVEDDDYSPDEDDDELDEATTTSNVSRFKKEKDVDTAYSNWRTVRGDFINLGRDVSDVVDEIDDLFYDITTSWPKVSNETYDKLISKLREIGASVHVFEESKSIKEAAKYPEGSWEVSYSDKNYNKVSKIFKNDPQGAAGETETKARNYAKKLSDKHANDRYGFIRGAIHVKSLH